MVTPYLAQQSVNDFGALVSAQKFSASIPAGVDVKFVVPGDSPRYKAVIRSLVPVWLSINGAPQVPVGPGFLSTSSELVPPEGLCREVKAADSIEVISTPGTDVSIVLYSLNSNN